MTSLTAELKNEDGYHHSVCYKCRNGDAVHGTSEAFLIWTILHEGNLCGQESIKLINPNSYIQKMFVKNKNQNQVQVIEEF